MPAPNAEQIMRLWELAAAYSTIERAVAVLGSTAPDTAAGDLACLTLGQRNARLLEVHRQLFGDALNAFVECPACAAPLEFAVPVDAIASLPTTAEPNDRRLQAGEYAIEFRLLDSVDLRVAAAAGDPGAAKRLLVERAVLSAGRNGEHVEAGELPERVIDALAGSLASADPGADGLIDVRCAACAWSDEVPLDVPAFVCAELDAQARRLLREVGALARACGWRESD